MGCDGSLDEKEAVACSTPHTWSAVFLLIPKCESCSFMLVPNILICTYIIYKSSLVFKVSCESCFSPAGLLKWDSCPAPLQPTKQQLPSHHLLWIWFASFHIWARFVGEAVHCCSLHLDLLLTEVSLVYRVVQRSPLVSVHVCMHLCVRGGADLWGYLQWRNVKPKASISPDTWWDCAYDPVYGGEGRRGGALMFLLWPCAKHMFVLTVEIPRISPNKHVDWGPCPARLGFAPYITK